MSISYIQLLTFPAIDKSENELPDSAKAYIAVSCETSTKIKGKEFIFISPQCRTAQEVEEGVNELIKELKKINGQAKSFFQKERGR